MFPHKVIRPRSPWFRGFDDVFYAPHSRYTTVNEEDILAVPDLQLLATSPDAGVYAVKSEDNRRFFIMGHPEYDPESGVSAGREGGQEDCRPRPLLPQ